MVLAAANVMCNWKWVLRMFLVPRPNSPHVNFIVSLDNAMRQGQTSYPFVVMQFDSENVTSVEVNLEEAELKERGLEKQIEGMYPAHNVFFHGNICINFPVSILP